MLKRFCDIFFSLICLILLAFPMMVIAALVRMSGKGKVSTQSIKPGAEIVKGQLIRIKLN